MSVLKENQDLDNQDSQHLKLGDRMKIYEKQWTYPIAIPDQPLVVRLDGKTFSNYTRKLIRDKSPFSSKFTLLMRETCMHLFNTFGPTFAFTVSDEITLVFTKSENSKSEYIFGGKLYKIQSLMAASASVFFVSQLSTMLPEKVGTLPIFDCRAFSVPNLMEAYNCVLWRHQDGYKNFVSCVARLYYSNKQLFKKNTSEQEAMLASKNIDLNTYDQMFMYGTCLIKTRKKIEFSAEELEKLPEKHNARTFGIGEYWRNVIEEISIVKLRQCLNLDNEDKKVCNNTNESNISDESNISNKNIMPSLQELQAFMNQYDKRITKNNILHPTHVLLSESPITYMIPASEEDKFLELYSNVLQEKLSTNSTLELNYLERVPSEKVPILLDIDLKYNKNQRLYTNDHIKYILKIFYRIAHKYFITEDYNGLDAYILEKKYPEIKDHIFRDGFHIVFPHIIVTRVAFKRILDEMQELISDYNDPNNSFATFKNEPINPDNILNTSIPTNCWYLYGSSKSNKLPYLLTQKYNYKLETQYIGEITSITKTCELVKLLSVRNKQKDTYMQLQLAYFKF